MRTALLFLAAATSLAAQVPRSVEAFGQVGAMRFGGDEGSEGTAATYGGAVLVPLTSKWALDTVVATAKRENSYSPSDVVKIRRTLIAPAVVRRFGSEKAYGFAGGGLGLQSDSTNARFTAGSPTGSVTTFENRDNGGLLIGRLGGVFNPWSQLLIRGEVELAFRYVLPNVSARIGAGWRF
jgi:hypothetical protein